MRIIQLLRREPFGSILAKTLSSFWNGRSGSAYVVAWRDEAGQRALAADAQWWLCNTSLNGIFVSGAADRLLAPIRHEFSRAGNMWLRPLQWSYVQAATRRPFAAWLARPRLAVSPPLPSAEHLMIIGGNHRIRILDHRNRQCHVIAKHNFDDRYMTRALAVRQRWPELPAPKLLNVEAGGRSFTEEYIEGTPINRIGHRKTVESALIQASSALQEVQKQTSQAVSPAEYSAEIAASIKGLAGVNRWLDDTDKARLLEDVSRARTLVESAARSGDQFATATSHGDFQPANILVDGRRTWLIDWEFSARRQQGYDPLVYALQSRSPAGLAERVRTGLNPAPSGQQLVEEWPGLDWKRPSGRMVALAVFLLEELAFHLEESDNALFYGLTDGFRIFRLEFHLALSYIESAARA